MGSSSYISGPAGASDPISEVRDKLSALGSEQLTAMQAALRQEGVFLVGRISELNEELAQQIRQVDCVAVQELFTQEGLKRWNTAMELYLEQSPQDEIDARQEVVARMRTAGYEAQELKLSGLLVSSIPDLSSLPKLRRLLLNNCQNLLELNISDLGALHTLNLDGCTGLQWLHLTNLATLQALFLNGCTHLEGVHFNNLRALERLYCIACISLRDLNVCACATMKWLQCDRCTSLQAVDITGLSSLQALLLRGCIGLRSVHGLDSVSAGCDVRLPNHLQHLWSHDAQNRADAQPAFVRIGIKRSSINSCPKDLFDRIVSHIKKNRDAVLSVRFVEEPAMDIGGVSKNLWCELSAVLFGEDEPNKLPASRSGVNAEKPEGDGCIPVIRAATREEDCNNLENFGLMMAWGARQNNPKLLIAPVLSSSVFQALHAHAKAQKSWMVMQPLMSSSSLQLLEKDIWSDPEWQEVRAIATLYLDMPEDNPQQFVRDRQDQLKQAILDDPVYGNHLKMIQALAAGLELGAPGELQRIAAMASPVEVQEHYQGGLDVDRFCLALHCDEYAALCALKSPTQEQINTLNMLYDRLQWFQGWIRNPLDRPEQDFTALDKAECKKLRAGICYLLTGRETLLVGEKVYLQFGEFSAPAFHDCVNRLDMPLGIATRELFRTALTNLVAVETSGYNRV